MAILILLVMEFFLKILLLAKNQLNIQKIIVAVNGLKKKE
jgi:hypothetical protein